MLPPVPLDSDIRYFPIRDSILSCASVQKLIGRLGYGVPVQSCTIFTNASKISVILSSRNCALI